MTIDKWELCKLCGRPSKPLIIFESCIGPHCRNFSQALFDEWDKNVRSKIDLWDEEERTRPQIDWAFVDKVLK